MCLIYDTIVCLYTIFTYRYMMFQQNDDDGDMSEPRFCLAATAKTLKGALFSFRLKIFQTFLKCVYSRCWYAYIHVTHHTAFL